MQIELVTWLQEAHNLKVSQSTVSNTLKRTAELLTLDTDEANPNRKRQQAVQYPMMESALVEWFQGHPERVNMSGVTLCVRLPRRFSIAFTQATMRPTSLMRLAGSVQQAA